MIKSIRHKALKRFWQKGDASKLNPQHIVKIRLILAVLNRVSNVNNINIPGGRLHKLTGDLKDFWSLSISGNWRIIFRIGDDGHIYDIDYVDYH